MKRTLAFVTFVAIALSTFCTLAAAAAKFGPSNPFYAPSTLPFHAPPFDKIKDEDYQPAIEAGMASNSPRSKRLRTIRRHRRSRTPSLPMEKSGRLLERASQAFEAVSGANTNPVLQRVKTALAPKLAAHARCHLSEHEAVRARRCHLQAARDTEARSGIAAPGRGDLRRVRSLRRQSFGRGQSRAQEVERGSSRRSRTDFSTKLLEATKDGAYATDGQSALAGLSDAQLAAAAQAAQRRKQQGYVLPLQNTTQQPRSPRSSVRATREAIFENSWNRTERGDANDTRDIISRLAQLRAQRATTARAFPNHAAWKLEDQMAKTPEAALAVHGCPGARWRPRRRRERGQGHPGSDRRAEGRLRACSRGTGSSTPNRCARRSTISNEAEIKPYFELNNVLENGVFYAANQLYGITFKERKDIPVYQPDVRVFEVTDVDGKPLALFYCDYFKRDNKNGGAWMSMFVRPVETAGRPRRRLQRRQSAEARAGGARAHQLRRCDDDVPRVRPCAARHVREHRVSELIGYRDRTRLRRSFPRNSMSTGPSIPRSSITTPGTTRQARRCRPSWWPRSRKRRTFDEGYPLTELLAAAELDMQWHMLPASARCRIRTSSKSKRSRRPICCSAPCRRAIARAISAISGAGRLLRRLLRLPVDGDAR